jgi:antitoxin HigA-1
MKPILTSGCTRATSGRRAVTAETALRLGRFFGTSADFWLGLQAAYDLEVARHALGEKIKAEVRPRAA